MSPGAVRPVELLSAVHHLDQFESGVDDLDRWLRRSARVAAAAGTAATYVLCRGERVIGYHALAMSAVVHLDAPSRLRRGMPDPVPVVLSARLALDRTEQGQRLGGHLLVDAIDERAAAFYRYFDFHDFAEGRLRRRLADIAAATGT